MTCDPWFLRLPASRVAQDDKLWRGDDHPTTRKTGARRGPRRSCAARRLLLPDLHGLVNAQGFGHAGVFRTLVGGHDTEAGVADFNRVSVRPAVVALHGERALGAEFVEREI